jgi:hypothetical protein
MTINDPSLRLRSNDLPEASSIPFPTNKDSLLIPASTIETTRHDHDDRTERRENTPPPLECVRPEAIPMNRVVVGLSR